MARIIKTTSPVPSDTLGQLAFYSGMDTLTLYEINSGLDELLTPDKRATYEFEMELQAALFEMTWNGILVDQVKRAELIKEHETELQTVHEYLHSFCEAIGYYRYFIERAKVLFADATGIPIESLPSSWDEWLAEPIQWRREVKKGNEPELKEFHDALKTFGPPYLPGDRDAWRRKKNGAFNGNSTNHKLRLFYDFFGSSANENFDTRFKANFPKSRAISEIRTRSTKNEWTPSADRESLEKIQRRGQDFDPKTAAYLALPFISCCLDIADYAKTLGFLRCSLDNGYFRASFGAVTDTGRLASRENAQGYSSNAQNVTPRLRIIFTAEPGLKLATPDYEQIESRNVGAICFRLFGATSYLDACECGDLHTFVCSLVWPDLPWPAEFTLDYLSTYGPPFPKEVVKAAKALVTKDKYYRHFTRRDLVKRLSHGTNYRGKPEHMAKQTHIEFELVKEFQSTYFSAFPELTQWHTWVVQQLQTSGEITTMFNRVRRFFGRPNDDSTIRAAIAHEPQSMAADYTNQALLRLLKSSLDGSLPIKLFLQKHDEIGFKYPETAEDLIVPAACDIMTSHHTLTAPDGTTRDWSVPVEPLVGWNLAHADKTNPDGLIEFTGHDSRKRQTKANDFMKRRL